MTTRSKALLTRLVSVAVLAMLTTIGVAPPASADDFYWQGRRSSNWMHGIAGSTTGGISNWYTLPPLRGQVLDPPGDDAESHTAIFAGGARISRVTLASGVGLVKMLFLSGAPQYQFYLAADSLLSLRSVGLYNRSNAEPRFSLRPKAYVTLRDARMFSFTSARPGLFYLEDNSGLILRGASRGGTAWAGNTGGRIAFLNTASAERMTLFNYNKIQAPFSRIEFHHRSTGGNARLINQYNSTINFTQTLGPLGNGRLTVGTIQNYGLLYIGTRILGVTDTFAQPTGGGGRLHVSIYREEAGAIVVTNRAVLGGELILNVIDPIPGRAYGVVFANGGRVGKFSEVTTSNVTMPRPWVTYTENGVILTF